FVVDRLAQRGDRARHLLDREDALGAWRLADDLQDPLRDRLRHDYRAGGAGLELVDHGLPSDPGLARLIPLSDESPIRDAPATRAAGSSRLCARAVRLLARLQLARDTPRRRGLPRDATRKAGVDVAS